MHSTNLLHTFVLSILAASTFAAPMLPSPAGPPRGQHSPLAPAPPQAVNPPVVGNIVIAGVTYSLLEERPGPVGSSTWTLTDTHFVRPAILHCHESFTLLCLKVARQFRTADPDVSIREQKQKAYDYASARIPLVLARNPSISRSVVPGIELCGTSKISGRSDMMYSWILEPRGPGKGIRQQTQAWGRIHGQGRQACTTFLRGTVATQLAAYLYVYYQKTGLVHLHPDECESLES